MTQPYSPTVRTHADLIDQQMPTPTRVAFLYARPGGPDFTDADRRWRRRSCAQPTRRVRADLARAPRQRPAAAGPRTRRPRASGVADASAEAGLASYTEDDSETGETTYIGLMNTVHLSDEELALARQALQAYLRVFGHDEADTHREIRAVLAKLRAAEPDSEEPQVIA